MKVLLFVLCCLCGTNWTSAQTFNWAFGIGGTDYDTVEDIESDDEGNFYVVGRFGGTMDIDPGPGISTLTSNGNLDLYVAAFNANSNLLWAVSAGGNLSDYATNVACKNNSLIVTGTFRGTVDLDPGIGIESFTSAGDEDIFLLSLTDDGVFQWAETFGGVGEDHPDGLAIDYNEDILLAGLYTGTVDFDPNAGVTTQSPTGAQDAFIAKYTGTGGFLWAHGFGTSPGEFCYDLDTDNSGNVYACGLFYGTLDFDPGAGVFNLAAGSNYAQCFALKWTSDGQFSWAGMFGGSQSNSAYDITWDENGYMLVTGYYNGTGDFDPGPGVFTLVTESSLFYADMFVLKLSDTGIISWAVGIGVNGSLQTGYAMDVDQDGNVFVTGLYDGVVDFDPGAGVASLPNNGVSDAFLLHLNADGTFAWAGHVGGTQGDFGSTIHYSNGNLLTGGNFSWYDVDLDPTEGDSLYTSVSYTNDGFVISNTVDNCAVNYAYIEVPLCPYESYFVAGAEQTIPGLYTEVYINQAGCDSIIDVLLYPSEINWTPFSDTVLCEENTLELQSDYSNPAFILWNNGEQTESIIVSENGEYWFMVEGDFCTFSDTIEVLFGSIPAITFEFPEAQCSGAGSVSAIAVGDAPFTYQWNDAQNQTTATADGLMAGNYSVSITDVNGCEAINSVDVLVESSCLGDFDLDGAITVTDMMMFVGAYGCQNNCCPFDLTQDGLVSVSDLVLFISSFGQICP